MKLRGRRAVITGAASGIGAAVAECFAQEGAKVALIDQNEDGAFDVAARIRRFGGVARCFTADVTDSAAANSIVAELVVEWGGIDALVTSAGMSVHGTLITLDEDTWDRVIAVNLKGTYVWLRAVLPAMISHRAGSIVTVGSQLAIASGGNNAAYIAAKGAIISLTKTVAVDHARDGIRINSVIPAVIDTPLSRRSLARYVNPDEVGARWMARHPLNRFGKPEEVAKAALFLVSDDSSFTTGSLLFVDGGWTAT